MKAPGVLGRLFVLFALTHGLDDVSVTCTEYWLRVRIRRTPILENLQPQHYELYLGTGCPVTSVLFDFFEFMYPISNCGIMRYEHIWDILIESSLTYESILLNIRGQKPIACTIQRKISFIFVKRDVENKRILEEETITVPVVRENVTSSQVGNEGILPEVLFGTSFSFVELYEFVVTFSKGKIKL